MRIFKNLRFSAASVSVTSAFFALFGFVFLITQYFQLVRGYTPLEAGVRTLPVAFAIAAASVLSPRLVERIGTKLVVAGGLGSMAFGFAWVSVASASTPYLEIVGQMLLLGGGLGATTAPATESIMGSLPVDKAGIGSAVNDTTRELGGTLGVAVIGSVFSSVYVNTLADGPIFSSLPASAQESTEESVVAAGAVAQSLGPNAGAFFTEVSDAFLAGQQVATTVVAVVAVAGALFALRFLPARAEGAVEDGSEFDLAEFSSAMDLESQLVHESAIVERHVFGVAPLEVVPQLLAIHRGLVVTGHVRDSGCCLLTTGHESRPGMTRARGDGIGETRGEGQRVEGRVQGRPMEVAGREPLPGCDDSMWSGDEVVARHALEHLTEVDDKSVRHARDRRSSPRRDSEPEGPGRARARER